MIKKCQKGERETVISSGGENWERLGSEKRREELQGGEEGERGGVR